MAEVLLILAFLSSGICGYWIMDRVDRFLNKYVEEEEEEADEQQR